MIEEFSDVIVVASCNVDLISYVEKLPKMGETIMGKEFKIGFGGKGANKAIACSRLGSKCSVIAKLGDDIFGKNYLDNFKENKIDTSRIFITNLAATGVAPICVDRNGENSIIVILGANLLLSPEDIETCDESIKNSKILVTNLEIPIKSAIKSLEIAKKYNVKTVLNFAPAVLDELDEKLFKYTDFLILNEVEVEQLSHVEIKKESDVQTAGLALLDKHDVKIGIIVTLGHKGVIFVDRIERSSFHVPCNKVNVVDTSGAGDAFVGAFVHYLNRAGSVKEAIELASFYASLTVQTHGTQSSYPSVQELDQKFKI
ncbi:unnamed protein product [Brachionus calyciflorus]|uniref:Ribokinase n=1 Tax=Brachionus calyciflorus TaxID=104777 RepID=A0A813VJ60_9BILA|nr:unnamed protein product [Brachionus calyciflorus]